MEQTLAAREHGHSHPEAHGAADCHDDHCHAHHHHEHEHTEGVACTDGAAPIEPHASSHDHHHHDHEHKHEHKHKHDDRVTSVGIQTEGTADMTKLNEWLSVLLKERGPDLYRSKGILSVQGSDDRWGRTWFLPPQGSVLMKRGFNHQSSHPKHLNSAA